MSLDIVFDLALCLIVISIAASAVAGRDPFGGVALYVVYGLLLSVAWVRLGAIDVALAEAAIGAGLTGVLLMGAVICTGSQEPVSTRARILPLLICFCLAGALAFTAFEISQPSSGLRPLVLQNLNQSGASNPVTAVLLNFRGWDTLLESVVLVVALVGAWSLTSNKRWGKRVGLRQHVGSEGVLAAFGRILPPIGIVIGLYLVWNGSTGPGGAFQAGTVLAAVWLLAIMAGLTEPPPVSSNKLRWALIFGPLLFSGVGFYGLSHGAFLKFPPEDAKILIMLVELGLAGSIGVALALLVLGPPGKTR